MQHTAAMHTAALPMLLVFDKLQLLAQALRVRAPRIVCVRGADQLGGPADEQGHARLDIGMYNWLARNDDAAVNDGGAARAADVYHTELKLAHGRTSCACARVRHDQGARHELWILAAPFDPSKKTINHPSRQQRSRDRLGDAPVRRQHQGAAGRANCRRARATRASSSLLRRCRRHGLDSAGRARQLRTVGPVAVDNDTAAREARRGEATQLSSASCSRRSAGTVPCLEAQEARKQASARVSNSRRAGDL
jgi:hypothetical protein